MTLTNRSSTSRAGVRLVRYVNGNIDNGATDDRYARDTDAVWGWEDGAGRHGPQLTALTFATSHSTVVETFASWNPTGSGAKTARGCEVIRRR
jgi:hypothetical protein